MENLVLCPCGHALSSHEYAGCVGNRSRPCPCRRDRYAALEAAVDSVKTTPVYSSYSPGQPDAA
jgi:hypothetical protein